MIWVEAHLTVVVTAIVLLVTWSLIQQERRTPQSTLAWLLFLMVLPYVAIPAFLAFGYRKGRSSRRRDRFEAPETEAQALDRLLTGYRVAPATTGNALSLLPEREGAFGELMALCGGAQNSLWITLYALGDDPVGRAFCEVLCERAKAGVQVRVILDSIGSLRRPRAALRALKRAGGQVRLYSPLLHSPFGGHINLRNHRKMVIADGVAVWAGGRNVAEHCLGPTPLPGGWHDLSFLLRGPAVSGFVALFRNDWAATGNGVDTLLAAPDGSPAGETALRLVPSGPDTPSDPLHDALVYGCHAATRRIWIVTPYFVPTDSLAEALAIAGRRGIDVRILLPARSNQRLADLARGNYLRALERSGCRFLLVPEVMVHAKAVLTDATAFFGSANLDVRSLMLNYELMVMTRDEPTLTALEGWAESMFAQAVAGVPAASRGRRVLEALFRLGSPIL